MRLHNGSLSINPKDKDVKEQILVIFSGPAFMVDTAYIMGLSEYFRGDIYITSTNVKVLAVKNVYDFTYHCLLGKPRRFKFSSSNIYFHVFFLQFTHG